MRDSGDRADEIGRTIGLHLLLQANVDIREKAQKTKAVALPAKNTANAKRTADRPLHSELVKKRQDEDTHEGDFIQIVFITQKNKDESKEEN